MNFSKYGLNRAEFLVRQSKKLHTACENDYSKRALVRALQLKSEINKKYHLMLYKVKVICYNYIYRNKGELTNGS